MLQCFSETGEPVQDFRIGFEFDARNREVRQVVRVQGSEHDYARTAAEVFVDERDDPFWISATDNLYFNSSYDYSEELRCFMTASIAERCQTEIKAISITAHSLGSLGLALSPHQVERFRNGRPLWRRSALSCKPGRGKKDSFSPVTERLRDSLASWLVFNELVVRYAVEVDLKRKDTKFPKRKEKDLKTFAKSLLSQPLGLYEGVGEGKSCDAPSDHVHVCSPRNENERLVLDKAARTVEGAHGDGRTRYFKNLFVNGPGKIGTKISAEMKDFNKTSRIFDAEFDVNALIKWSGENLIVLRIALAASLKLDKSRNKTRKLLRKAKSDDARYRVANKFTLEWLKGIYAEEGDGSTIDVALEDLLDLQIAAFLAMATGVNPRLLFPYMSYGIDDKFDEETSLTSELFMGALWLGELFRKRSSLLDRHHAQAIVTSCNPASLPRGLPLDRMEEWVTATRLMTSFLTQAGLDRLMEAANDVLNDGVSRQILAGAPRQWQPLLPKKKPNTFEQLRCAASLLPAPVAVEAGWLLLPGNYQKEWVGKSDPVKGKD